MTCYTDIIYLLLFFDIIENNMAKSLRIFSNFMTVGPGLSLTQGRITQSRQTQDIKMGSCVFQCGVSQCQVGPLSVYSTVTGLGVNVINVLCLRGSKQAPSQYDLSCLKCDVKPQHINNVNKSIA